MRSLSWLIFWLDSSRSRCDLGLGLLELAAQLLGRRWSLELRVVRRSVELGLELGDLLVLLMHLGLVAAPPAPRRGA